MFDIWLALLFLIYHYCLWVFWVGYNKYQNKAGTYTESSLLRLLYVIYSHRLEHLIKDGKWMD